MSRRTAESAEGGKGGNRVVIGWIREGWMGRVGGLRVVRINPHLRTS